MNGHFMLNTDKGIKATYRKSTCYSTIPLYSPDPSLTTLRTQVYLRLY